MPGGRDETFLELPPWPVGPATDAENDEECNEALSVVDIELSAVDEFVYVPFCGETIQRD